MLPFSVLGGPSGEFRLKRMTERPMLNADTLILQARPILFVQVNDLYHIDSLADFTNSDSLILPRIATCLTRLRDYYGTDQVFFCLPGDFLAPSCLSKQFKGAHMVSVLNQMGLDFVTFGNHEFDDPITREDLVDRIDQSNFKWIISNLEFPAPNNDSIVSHANYQLVHPIWLSKTNLIILFGVMYKDKSVTVPFIHDPVEMTKVVIEACQEAVSDATKQRSDLDIKLNFVALTHQSLDEDLLLAQSCSDLCLIMGGHDHDVVESKYTQGCAIVKAASNARTVRLNWVVAISQRQIDELRGKSKDRLLVDNALGQALAKYIATPTINKMFFDKHRAAEAELSEKIQVAQYFQGGGLFDRMRILGRRSGEDFVFVFSQAIKTTESEFVEIIPEDQFVRREHR